MKKTCKALLKYPGILILPLFSFWVIGPKSKSYFSSCCSKVKEIGISFSLSWLNICLTIGGYLIIMIPVVKSLCEGPYCQYFIIIVLIVPMILAILLVPIIQCLDRCCCCCCTSESCCIANCETIQVTYLDIDNMDGIPQEDVELCEKLHTTT